MKINIIGHKYGKLTVLEPAPHIRVDTAWVCLCDCGKIKNIKTEYLRNGDTKSCGCFNNEKRSERAKNFWKINRKYSPIESSARIVWKDNYDEMLFEDFYKLSQMNCYYCNRPPSNFMNTAGESHSEHAQKNGNFIYSGLDRRNNNLTHTKENCVPCCKYCNYAKRDRTEEEFKQWIRSVYHNFIK